MALQFGQPPRLNPRLAGANTFSLPVNHGLSEMGFSFIEIGFSREDKKIQKCTTIQQRATLTRTTIVTTQRLDGYLLDFIYTVQK